MRSVWLAFLLLPITYGEEMCGLEPAPGCGEREQKEEEQGSRIGELSRHIPTVTHKEQALRYFVQEHVLAEVVDPLFNETFHITDVFYYRDGLSAARYIFYKHRPGYFLTAVSLVVPKDLVNNMDSSRWQLNYLEMPHHYDYVHNSLAAVFAVEALSLHPRREQSVLSLGLGGGAMQSFLHAADLNVAVTAVDISPTMVRIARDWFGLSDGVRVRVQDGVEHVRAASEQGERYDAILLDACGHDGPVMCPVDVFYSDSAIADMTAILHPHGALVANVLVVEGQLKVEEELLEKYKKHFPSCLMHKFSAQQSILICSHHRDFLANRDRIDARNDEFFERFGFGMSQLN